MNESIEEKRGNFLLRQELTDLTIHCTPICSFVFNFIIGMILLGVAIASFKSCEDYKEYRVEYTDCHKSTNFSDICVKQLVVEEDLEPPIDVFFRIENFYINHKDFVRSKSYDQLRNKFDANSTIKNCEGVEYMYQTNLISNSNNTEFYSFDKSTKLLNTSRAYPCGLFPKYFFNDYFEVHLDNKIIPIDSTNFLSWLGNSILYKNHDNATQIQYINIEDRKLNVIS